jgi:hypothetical protein
MASQVSVINVGSIGAESVTFSDAFTSGETDFAGGEVPSGDGISSSGLALRGLRG